MSRAIDADALIDDLKHDVAVDQDSLDYEELTDSNRENIQFDKDCKQNAIDLLQHAPTIEPRCETCEAFNKTRLLISQPQQRWMPCSKELPERNLVVLVTTRWGEVTEGVKLTGNAWFIGRGEDNAFDSDILAWMPKPEPYAERRTDEKKNI